jgi:RNA polymerase sigma-70 factor (ECF subfamily)
MTATPTVVADADAELTEAFARHRRELHIHCYRLTGSFTDAEDLTQETYLRAWRSRDRFEARSSMRTWLYRIATNACLDHLKRHERRVTLGGDLRDPLEHDPLIQPYPDRLLVDDDPADAVTRRETTSLLFVAALARLPPRQRAALIARDVLGLSGADTAMLLGTSPASAHSLVQRARAAMRAAPPDAAPAAQPIDDEIARRYVEAHERGDADAIIAMLRDDVRVTMPPEAPCRGRAEASELFRTLLGAARPGDWALVPTRANGLPATANYLRRPGERTYRALSIDVLDIRDGQVVRICCFLGDQLFAAFDLPRVLDASWSPTAGVHTVERRAAIGSMRAARQAGNAPATTPTARPSSGAPAARRTSNTGVHWRDAATASVTRSPPDPPIKPPRVPTRPLSVTN